LYSVGRFQLFWLIKKDKISNALEARATDFNIIQNLPAEGLLAGVVSARLVAAATADRGAARDLKSVGLTKQAA
jgi:hypothetical protein